MGAGAIFLFGLIIIAAVAIFSGLFTVEQQRIAIVERFGKFLRLAQPGLNLKIPFVDRIAGTVNLRVQQLNVPVETKSQDNVFVKVAVSVQYHVISDKTYQAFYKLENPEQQITAFVFDVVRARVPTMKLDDVFEKKDEIANAVKQELDDIMAELGYNIVKSLVTDIDPDAKVKTAMNEINEAQRLRIAANERGEAEKILKVKQAEAEAESAALQGQGMANQRKAIIEGLQTSVAEFQSSISDLSATDVMNIVMLTQYFDTLKEIGANNKSNSVMIPHSPNAVSDLTEQMRNAFISADMLNKKS